MARNLYDHIMSYIFKEKYDGNGSPVTFTRDDVVAACEAMDMDIPKNIGDFVYSYRYRKELPESIRSTAPMDMSWIIRGDGSARYTMSLSKEIANIAPNENLYTIKIPDATPEIVRAASRGDEQALLAIVRYNRLIDIFLGITTYTLQSHLRTQVKGIGQVEVDEIYVGVDCDGRQYIIPVEAKGHADKIGRVQSEQDLAVCRTKWPDYKAVAIAVQFMNDSTVAMFELSMQDDSIKIMKELHYALVPADDISLADRVNGNILL